MNLLHTVVAILVTSLLVAGCTSAGLSSLPAASLSTVPSQASASPVASIGQTNSPIAKALAARLLADPLVTHLEYDQTITFTSSGSTSPSSTIRLSGDFSGEDCAYHLTVLSSDGQATADDVAVVGAAVYFRIGEGAWQSMPSSMAQVCSRYGSADFRNTVRQGADPGILSYVDVDTVDGRQLHHLEAVKMPPFKAPGGSSGAFDSYDMWAESDGTPVVIRTTFTAATDSGDSAAGTEEVRFSNFGQPIAIAAPSIAPFVGPSAAAWLVYTGPGFDIEYPPQWTAAPAQGGTGVEFIAPNVYPFLKVSNDGSVPDSMTLELLASADLSDITGNLGSTDATQSETTLGGVDAVVTRFHNTGSTGIEYYSLKAIAIRAGTWYEVALYSLAGQESESDQLFTQFLTSFEFKD